MKYVNEIRTLLSIIALGVLAAGCDKPAASTSSSAGGMPAMPVTVNQPVQREVIEWDQYQGRLDSVETVEIRAKVNGYLQSVNFKDGAEVQKGDLLFVIDPRPYQAEVDRAQADLKQAQTKLELAINEAARSDRLLKEKAISEEEADARVKARHSAEAMVQSNRAALDTAKLNLDYTRITAPISGRIGRKLMTEGNLINSGQGQSTLLATIVSLDPIYCYFDADEASVLKYQQLAREGKQEALRDGKVACELALANETGYPHQGRLDFVDNRVDPSTGTLRVRAVFANPGPDRLLQPGFFARVRVPGTAKYSTLLIPDAAVGTDQNQKFVYTVSSTNTIQYTVVKLGPVIDGLRVVRGGLKPEDLVVVDGLMMIHPGSAVNPLKAAIGEKPPMPAAAKK